jgi:hypothetical protein
MLLAAVAISVSFKSKSQASVLFTKSRGALTETVTASAHRWQIAKPGKTRVAFRQRRKAETGLATWQAGKLHPRSHTKQHETSPVRAGSLLFVFACFVSFRVASWMKLS